MSSYFDESYYLSAKLKHLSSLPEFSGSSWTLDSLKQAIADAGMTPEQHYQTYGRSEKLNPNSYFNEAEYLATKLASLREDPKTAAEWTNKSVNDLAQTINAAGMTPAEHYETYGAFETRGDGTLLNPSNAFDANAYFAAKLQQLITSGEPVNGKSPSELTVADVVQAVKDAGFSPVTHYVAYGAAEAGEQLVPLVQTVPSEQRVPNDPGRSVTGEFVPGNYNPPSAPPSTAVAAPVAKPADMGGKAPAAVSPVVTPPSKPLPVPGDAGYVPPPANLVDTNAKPVVPPSTSGTGNVTDNWVTVNPDGSGTVIKPDGTPGGTLPPGTITDPSKPVVPDVPPTPPTEDSGGTGGGSGGGSGGGGGGGGDGGGGETTFTVTESADTAGEWTVGKDNGTVTITTGTDTVGGTPDTPVTIFTPTTGSAVKVPTADIGSLKVAGTVTGKAAVFDGLEVSGTGTVTVTDLHHPDDRNTLVSTDLEGLTTDTVNLLITQPIRFDGKLPDGIVLSTPQDFEGFYTPALYVQDSATLGEHIQVDGITLIEGSAAALGGKIITGTGGVGISPMSAGVDLSGCADTLSLTVLVLGSCDLTSNNTLASVRGFLLGEGADLTVNADQISSAYVVNWGEKLTVKGITSDSVLNIENMGEVQGTVLGTVTSTQDLTGVDLSALTGLTIDDNTASGITVTVRPDQYAFLKGLGGSLVFGAADTLVSTDTTAPTATITSAAYVEKAGVLTLTGSNWDSILEDGEDAATNVVDRLDWTKLTFDTDGPSSTTGNVNFSATDITSAHVINASTVVITLKPDGITRLENTASYGGGNDKIVVQNGFARDVSDNAATTDGADLTLTITADTTPPTFTMSGPESKTYKLDDKIVFTATFDEQVAVTGTPQIELTLDTGGKVYA